MAAMLDGSMTKIETLYINTKKLPYFYPKLDLA